MVTKKRTTQTQKKCRSWVRITMAAAVAVAATANLAPAAIGTWTGGNGGSWTASDTNWSGLPAGTPWDNVTGPTHTALFATVGDSANIVGIVFPGAMTFNESATIGGGLLGWANTESTLAVLVDAAKVGTINSDFSISGAPAAGQGNEIYKTGTGKLTLTGNTVLVGDLNANLSAGFTVEGGGELQISNALKAASSLQSNRGNFTNRIGADSANNILRIDGVSFTTVYAGGMLVGGDTLVEAAMGGNQVIISRQGDITNPSYNMSGNGQQLNMGVFSSNNSFTVSNGAFVVTSQGGGTNTWTIGTNAGANSNAMLVTGAGSTIQSGSNAALIVGAAGDGNSLTVSNGGAVLFRRLEIGSNGGDNNFVLISGPTSSFNGNGGQQVFQIGSGRALSAAAAVAGTGNYLRIENGADFIMDAGHNRGYNIGGIAGADDNYVLVTGAGSVFTMQQAMPLAIGGGAGNNNNVNNVTNTAAAGNHLDIYAGARSNQRTLFVMGVDSAVNLGNGVGVSELELGHSANGGADLYGAGLILANTDSRLNVNGGRIIAGATSGGATGNNLVTGYMGSLTNTGTAFSGPGMIDLLGTGYVQVNNADTRLISVQITGVGDLHKEGTGTLQLTSLANSYTGDTYVDAGVLSLADDFLADAADVIIAVSAMMDLTFGFGVGDTINALSLGGVGMAPGTYGSTSSNATFQNDTYFSGTGHLNVLNLFEGGGGGGSEIPAPAALPAGLAIMALAAMRRNRR